MPTTTTRAAAARKPQKIRVLVVTDDEDLAKTTRLALNHGSFITRVAESAAAAIAEAKAWRPQIAVVQAEIEKPNAIPLLSESPSGRRPIGVIAITRRGNMQVKLAAFDAGADDIIQLPYAPEELIARVLAVARRTVGATEFYAVMRLGDLEIDLLRRRVKISGHEIELTPLEQSLLYLLAANAGEVMTRERILDALWGTDFVAESNVVDAQVRLLRIRLQNDAHAPRFIETVPGKGYRFITKARRTA